MSLTLPCLDDRPGRPELEAARGDADLVTLEIRNGRGLR